MTLLSSLSPAEFRVLLLVNEYLRVRRRRGFIYDGIKAFAAETGFYRDYSDRTLDRTLRELARKDFFERIEKKVVRRGRKVKITIYIPTPKFWAVMSEREGLIHYGLG